ncbi:uncharacterized protein JCM15063_003306 [Sporobolomyces koalae]|uniref:uncharacterized protein n=1 Tax=Sporobolomyces koalae TaxID=500713 RepID=UPI0031715DF6
MHFRSFRNMLGHFIRNPAERQSLSTPFATDGHESQGIARSNQTIETSYSTDNSRQSSSSLVETPDSFPIAKPSGPSGIGKRTRIDASTYARPPLSSHSQLSSFDTSFRTGSNMSTSGTTPSNVPQAGIKTTNRKGAKTKVEVPVSCVSCGRRLVRLILRGHKHEFETPYECTFHCIECAPVDSPGENEDGTTSTEVDQTNAVLPNASSEPEFSQSRHSPSAVAPVTHPSSFRKKTKRLDEGAMLTACDVCLLDRAVGSVLPRHPEQGDTIDFHIEVVCVSCDEKYRRCSDCGGGGGVRLGTGKWRSKELFSHGKKTCSLRHQRLGAFPEMEYQVWKNTDLPRDEIQEVSDKCGEMFTNQILGAVAIPEVLERNGAVWTTFAEAQTHAQNGWKGISPMIHYDIEPTQAIRRYLALRLCSPNLRKTMRKAEAPPPAAAPRNGEVFKNDKEIVGYIIAEWDQHKGVLFLALVIPWDGTGEAWDANTLLLQKLCARVQEDHQQQNELRASRGQSLLPKLERVFTMIFFKTGSRMITQLVKKRGFSPKDEYLAANPEADPSAFPPHRRVYLPVERQQGWLVLIRTLKETKDGRIDDWSARRSADEERGKRKEARAKAARKNKLEHAPNMS